MCGDVDVNVCTQKEVLFFFLQLCSSALVVFLFLNMMLSFLIFSHLFLWLNIY